MRNFDYHNFNLGHLRKIKKTKNLSVGLGLPILNEEKTLKKILMVVRSCGDFLDKVICIDSQSDDNSVKICKEAGFDVIADYKIAKDLSIPLHRGKGWNLWGSLYYLNTDIIVWVDSDIKNFTRRFITGIVGPLIKFDDLKFIKGYYHRPKNDARVTEIMVRPFINLIFPELIDFIQPLAGEYGGRKIFLEKIDFYSGYSVEMAILLQAVFNLKDNEIAQAYLGKRIHELQSVILLGKMSSNILHTLLRIADDKKRIKLNVSKLPDTLTNFISNNGIDFISKRQKIADKKLPPMIKVKNYGK